MNEDVIALERHLNLRLSTSCVLASFVHLLRLFFLWVHRLCLVFDWLLKNDLFGLFLLSDDLVLTNVPLEFVVFFEESLVQFSRSNKPFFKGRLDDIFILSVFSFLELLFSLSFCLRSNAVAVDLVQ